MSVLVWDKVGDRFYDTGLDKGVLYLQDGSAVPWNGLTSISEKFDKDVSSVYYDGTKISDLVSLGNFSGTIKAFTYPEEFVNLEGFGLLRSGLVVGDQIPQTFSLSYRTKIGNDIDTDVGYKIHILYNLTAIPSDRAHQSLTESPEIIEFEWDISSIPEEVPGYRPTSQLVFNTTDLEPELLTFLEERLYGSAESDASLISIHDFISYMYTWARMEITDNGDGTWTARCLFDEDLILDTTDIGLFTLTNAVVNYVDLQTYEISNVVNTSDIL